MQTKNKKWTKALVGGALLVTLAMTAMACGDDGNAAASGTTPAPSTTSTAPMSAQFGAACSQVPANGAGSFAGMAQAPVATAASNNPLLSTLVTAVQSAGLVDTLNSAKGITVFAPINDAFAKLDPATLKAALADPKGLLSKVLTYHVIGQTITPQQLANGSFTSLEGAVVKTTGSGDSYTVNGNKVVCGNVQTANATVYLIDGVLLPAS